MSSSQKNKNSKLKKTDDDNKEAPINDNLKEELSRYLKIAEKEIKSKQIDDEAILELKKNNEENLEKLKTSKNEENIDALYNLTIDTVNIF